MSDVTKQDMESLYQSAKYTKFGLDNDYIGDSTVKAEVVIFMYEQLAAEKERADKAEDRLSDLQASLVDVFGETVQERLIAAEAKLKEAQAELARLREQEPHHWLLKPSPSNTYASENRRELSVSGKYNEHWVIEGAYYAEPKPSPEVAELIQQARKEENELLNEALDRLQCYSFDDAAAIRARMK